MTVLADAAAPVTRRDQLALARRVQCPVLVISGTEGQGDEPTPTRGRWRRRRVAKLLAIEGGDHLPEGAATGRGEPRDPRVRRFRRSAAIRDGPTASQRRRRALYVSSPIGLGHARRDVAIARELRDAAPGPGDRLARPGPGHPRARSGGRAHPSGQRAPGQRVRPTSSRSRPSTTCTCFQAHAADGRDPGRELHGLRRRRPRDAATTCGSATRPGSSTTTCTRTRAEARTVRLADRLRRLAADARGRRAGGDADRGLQRRDGRARRAITRRSATGRSSSATPTTSSPAGSARTCPGSASGPSATSTSPATSPASTRPSCGDRERLRAELGYRRTSASAWSRSAAPAWAPACCAGSSRPSPPRKQLVPGAADDRRRRPADRPGNPARGRRSGGARLRPRSLPPPRRLRPRGRPGRADDRHGADRRGAAIPLLPAAPPLRAAASTSPTDSTATGPAGGWTSTSPPPSVIAQAIAEEIGRDVDYRPVETDGARMAAERIAELLN